MSGVLTTIIGYLNTQAATSIIAILTASTAFIIYGVRKRDQKKDAANIILLELKSADRNLEEARKTYEAGKIDDPKLINFPEKLRLMQNESWTRYKYLFVRDLPAEQWDEISRFYENCAAYDEATELISQSFYENAAAIRTFIQRTIATFSLELAEKMTQNPSGDSQVEARNLQLLKTISDKKKIAMDGQIRHLVEIYTPDKPSKDAAYFFSLLPHSVVNTPTGENIRRLADRRILKINRNKLN